MYRTVFISPALIVISSVLTLSGCGGGSSGSSEASSTSNIPTAADLIITTDNATQTAATAADLQTNSGTTSSPLGADIYSTDNVAPSLFDVAKLTLNLAQTQTINIPTAASVENQTVSCSISGTMTISGQVTDQYDFMATTGDYISISASNCDTGSGTLNGDFSLRVISSSLASRIVKFDYQNLSLISGANQLAFPSLTSTFTFDGGYAGGSSFIVAKTTVQTTGSYTLTANGVSRTRAANQVTEVLRDGDYALDGTSQSQGYDKQYSINGLMSNSRLNGAVNYTTVIAFTFDAYASYPKEGQLIIAGESGKVRLTAQPDATNVFIELDANDDGIYESTQTLTWSELLANI